MAIMLPPGAELSNSVRSAREITIRDFSKSKPLERLLVIAEPQKGFRASYDRQVTWLAVAALNFR